MLARRPWPQVCTSGPGRSTYTNVPVARSDASDRLRNRNDPPGSGGSSCDRTGRVSLRCSLPSSSSAISSIGLASRRPRSVASSVTTVSTIVSIGLAGGGLLGRLVGGDRLVDRGDFVGVASASVASSSATAPRISSAVSSAASSSMASGVATASTDLDGVLGRGRLVGLVRGGGVDELGRSRPRPPPRARPRRRRPWPRSAIAAAAAALDRVVLVGRRLDRGDHVGRDCFFGCLVGGDGLDDLLDRLGGGGLFGRLVVGDVSTTSSTSAAASCWRTWANADASVLSIPPSGSWTASDIE